MCYKDCSLHFYSWVVNGGKAPYQGFSGSALWTFGARQSFVVGLSGHCRRFSSIPGCFLPMRCQYTLPPPLWQPKLSPDFAKCPQGGGGTKSPQLRTTALDDYLGQLVYQRNKVLMLPNEARTMFSSLPWAVSIKGQRLLRAFRALG